MRGDSGYREVQKLRLGCSLKKEWVVQFRAVFCDALSCALPIVSNLFFEFSYSRKFSKDVTVAMVKLLFLFFLSRLQKA